MTRSASRQSEAGGDRRARTARTGRPRGLEPPLLAVPVHPLARDANSGSTRHRGGRTEALGPPRPRRLQRRRREARSLRESPLASTRKLRSMLPVVSGMSPEKERALRSDSCSSASTTAGASGELLRAGKRLNAELETWRARRASRRDLATPARPGQARPAPQPAPGLVGPTPGRVA